MVHDIAGGYKELGQGYKLSWSGDDGRRITVSVERTLLQKVERLVLFDEHIKCTIGEEIVKSIYFFNFVK